jgi:hypothetical protein
MYLDLANTPILPPVVIPDRGENRRWHIIPDILFAFDREVIVHENFRTLIYKHMNRVFGFWEQFQYALAGSATYKLWLLGYPLKHGIPPHIVFGGAVEAIPGGDTTFHSRWVEYVHRELL